MKYTVVFEQSDNGFGAYLPDLPGCVALGDTLDTTKALIAEAVSLHIDLLVSNGLPIPEAQALTGLVEAG